MSWSVTRSSVALDELEERLRAAYTEYRGRYHDDDEAKTAMDEQFEAALAAAQGLITSGTIGEGRVNVVMSGHANPEHKPRQGWANDTISVIITNAEAFS